MVDALAAEIQQSQGRSHLVGVERRERLFHLGLLDNWPQLRQQLGGLAFADEAAINADTLAERVQVRLCIEAGAQASRAQDTLDQGSGRTFAFRTRDQRAGIIQVRIAQPREQGSFAFEIFLAIARKRATALIIAETVEIG